MGSAARWLLAVCPIIGDGRVHPEMLGRLSAAHVVAIFTSQAYLKLGKHLAMSTGGPTGGALVYTWRLSPASSKRDRYSKRDMPCMSLHAQNCRNATSRRGNLQRVARYEAADKVSGQSNQKLLQAGLDRAGCV